MRSSAGASAIPSTSSSSALGVAGFERGEDVGELSAETELLENALDARRREQLVDERGDASGRLGADELGDDAAVAEALHRRDALDSEGGRETLVRVDVDLREGDRAVAAFHLGVEDGRERVTRPTTRPRSRRSRASPATARSRSARMSAR